jgi:bifunctional DNase/RNase
VTQPSELVEFRVEGVGLDRENSPVVVLHEVSGERSVPIWIGHAEAHAIGVALEGKPSPRPLTADLLCAVIQELGASVSRLVIVDAHDNTYFARLFIQPENQAEKDIDCRPSDGIATALRTSAPIFMPQDLVDRIERERAERETLEKSRIVVDTGDTTVH